MDESTALIIVAAITATPSIGAFVLSAIAAVRADRSVKVSVSNNDILTNLVPTVQKVEKQTNHMQEVMQAQAIKIGIQTGRDQVHEENKT